MHRAFSVAILIAQLSATSVVTSIASAQEPVDFGTQIAPLLTRNCSACHNAKKPEGGLVLESFATLMKGGDSGDSIVPGMAEKSELLARVVATDDSVMPPDDNAVGAKRLTEAEVGLLKSWIAAGAPAPRAAASSMLKFRDITGSLKPIYASDVSPDGSYLAFGIGNVVALASNPFGAAAPRLDYLIDPELKLPDGTPIQATHVDLVQSIAFSPDSQRLAVGGFRSVKIWKRQTEYKPIDAPVPAGSSILASNLAGDRIAVETPEHAVVLVDADKMQPIVTLKGHLSPITAVAFVPNSQVVFSCDDSGRVLRWTLPAESQSTAPSEILFAEAAPSENVSQVTIDAKEVIGLAATSANSVIVLRKDKKVQSLQFNEANAEANVPAGFGPVAAFDRLADVHSVHTVQPTDSAQYLIAFANGAIEVVKPESAEAIVRFEQGAPLMALAVSRDGKRLSTAGASGPAKLWNLSDGKSTVNLEGDYENLRKLQVAERNAARQKALVDLLAARVPELKKEAEKEVEARKKVEEARTKAVEAIAAKVKEVEAAQAQVAATQASMEETRKAIEELNKKMTALAGELEAKQKAVAEADKRKQDADGELVKHDQALATATDSVERASALIPKQESLVAAETALLTTAQQTLDAQRAAPAPLIQTLAFDKLSNAVIAATADNCLNIFDAATGKALAKLQPSAVAIKQLFVSSDQRILGGDGNQWFAWNLSLPWSLERTFGSPFGSDSAASLFSDRITALDFSPDGQLLAVGSGPPSRFGDVKILNVMTGEVTRDLGEAHSDTVLGLRFSPDGRQLTSCGADKLSRLYQTESGELLRSFEGHTHHVLAVAWQSNGQTLATASADNSVKTWNVETGERKQSIGGFGKEVTAIEFVGQTDQIVTSSIDGQVKLHNASNGQQVRVFAGANSPLYSVSVSDDGQFIVSGGQSGQILIWKSADGAVLRKIPDDAK